MKNQLRVCLVTSPRKRFAIAPLSNLVDVLSHLFSAVYLITGNEGGVVCKNHPEIQSYSIQYSRGSLVLVRIIKSVILQFKISYRIFKLRNRVDLFMFFMAESLLLPTLAARLTRKRTVLVLASSAADLAKRQGDILSMPFTILEKLSYIFADRIIVYSPRLIQDWNLGKHKKKILVARRHFFEFDKFHMNTPLSERENFVGYIGRLSEEKGILNFVGSIKSTMEQMPTTKFSVGGDGVLQDQVEEYLDKRNLKSEVELLGWVQHDKLPDCLNTLRLLVIPSYTEGLPTLMLEAMACGTPVLATAVGAIPDIIVDGKTGFIMENNSPDCIAKNIVRALQHSNLEEISNNACTLVENEFTFEHAINQYRKILTKLV